MKTIIENKKMIRTHDGGGASSVDACLTGVDITISRCLTPWAEGLPAMETILIGRTGMSAKSITHTSVMDICSTIGVIDAGCSHHLNPPNGDKRKGKPIIDLNQ